MDSILNQTYTDIEIIVINDNKESPYSCQIRNYVHIVAEKCLINVIYCENSKCMGANYSRNRGINISHGEYIAFLDDDDEWHKEKIAIQLEKFIDSDVGLIYSNYYKCFSDGTIEKCFKAHREGCIFDELMCHNIVGVTSGVMLRRECIENCGYFDESLPARQDYDLWVRICEKYDVFHIELFLFNYYVSQDSISTNIKNRINGRKMVLKKYLPYYKKNPIAYCRTLIEFYYEMMLNHQLLLTIFLLVKIVMVDYQFAQNRKILSHFLYYLRGIEFHIDEYY